MMIPLFCVARDERCRAIDNDVSASFLMPETFVNIGGAPIVIHTISHCQDTNLSEIEFSMSRLDFDAFSSELTMHFAVMIGDDAAKTDLIENASLFDVYDDHFNRRTIITLRFPYQQLAVTP